MKETYLRHVKSWSFFFMVISPFLFLALSVGIGYLQGSSMAKNSKIAVVTTVPSVEEGLKGTNGINFDYKDEASAQAAIKDEKIKGYLTIDQEDSVLKAVYHGFNRYKNDIENDAEFFSPLDANIVKIPQKLDVWQKIQKII